MFCLQDKGINNLSGIDAGIVPQLAYGIIPWSILKNVFILNRLTISTEIFFRHQVSVGWAKSSFGRVRGEFFSR